MERISAGPLGLFQLWKLQRGFAEERKHWQCFPASGAKALLQTGCIQSLQVEASLARLKASPQPTRLHSLGQKLLMAKLAGQELEWSTLPRDLLTLLDVALQADRLALSHREVNVEESTSLELPSEVLHALVTLADWRRPHQTDGG